MNVLSLFDGMSCGQIALTELGVNIEKYYASEIDVHAIRQTQLNFPDTIQLGSVVDVDVVTIPMDELYDYLSKTYFKNDLQGLQGIISEREMLHRVNEKQSFAAFFGTQIQDENTEISKHSTLQINDRVWFFKNPMGDNSGVYDIVRSGDRRDKPNTINVGELCKYSFWWNGHGQPESKTKGEGVDGIKGAFCEGLDKGTAERRCESPIFIRDSKTTSTEDGITSVSEPRNEGQIPGRNVESECTGEVRKKEEDRRAEEAWDICKTKGDVHGRNDHDGVIEDNNDIIRLYSKIQVSIISCGWGVIISEGVTNLTLGGSPCQSFSFAGKRKGMSTKCEIRIVTLEKYLELKEAGFEFEGQSYLFWEYMRILTDIRKYNPDVKFLLENVEMGDKWESILSHAIGGFGVHINSNLVSAQNRKRIYWTNIRTKQVGLFSEIHSDIPQPKDEGILLKDILEEEVDEKYFLSDKMISVITQHGAIETVTNEKSNCILTSYHKMGGRDQQYIGESICVAMLGRNPENPSDIRTGSPTEQRLEPNTTGKTNYLTSVAKDNLVMLNDRQQNNFKSGNEKANTFLSTSWKGSQANGMTLINQSRIRRLTPTECSRLQTIPEWYKWECSDTQQYRMLGNGWTVKIIQHILSYLK